MKEFRRIDASKVRSLCIEYDFYTCGTCADYDNLLLNLCDRDREIDLAALIEIATDIVEHSSNRVLNNFEDDKVKAVLWYLGNECCQFYYE